MQELAKPSHPGGPVFFDYFGNDGPRFMASMEEKVQTYMSRPDLTWQDVFYHERLPWDAATSLDNVYSGLLVMLWRRHGERAFLRRWFRGAIPTLTSRRPASKEDWQTAADNFFLAACYSAKADLSEFFRGELRWPISADAAGPVLETVLAAAAVDEL